jgi:hypothetical protein
MRSSREVVIRDSSGSVKVHRVGLAAGLFCVVFFLPVRFKDPDHRERERERERKKERNELSCDDESRKSS